MGKLLRDYYAALRLALQFLTTLPAGGPVAVNDRIQGLAPLWYPLVGLLLGALMLLAVSLLSLPFYLEAILVLALWAALTGALHLDGLADCADALVGGLGDRQRRLELMQDPLCGSMAVVTLVVFLGLKVAAIAALLQIDQAAWLLWVPLLARCSILLLFITTPYARAGGLAAKMLATLPERQVIVTVALVAALPYSLLPAVLWSYLLLLSLLLFVLVRRAAMARLGGFTGDVAGAQVELIELVLMLALVGLL